MKCLKREETIINELSELYKSRGFRRYKPACFEEYSLYQDNKDFLIGKNVISFSDMSGRLMAMRPDVTLSLIRHNDILNDMAEKFFYNEKVYRQAAGGKNYKEISQVGVEVVGKIDMAVVAELTVLICRTLATVGENYVLDISHTGFTEGLLKEFGADKKQVTEYLKAKNLHDFAKLSSVQKYDDKLNNAFKIAVKTEDNIVSKLDEAEKAALNSEMINAVSELKNLYKILQKFGYADKINVDFSAYGNADYYNGIVFNGYIKEIPHSVLSGGRYDRLLNKFGKCGGAIGFALYLGEIDRYLAKDDDFVDYLIIYNDKTQIKALELAESRFKEGSSVRISTSKPFGLAFKNIVDLTDGGEQ